MIWELVFWVRRLLGFLGVVWGFLGGGGMVVYQVHNHTVLL